MFCVYRKTRLVNIKSCIAWAASVLFFCFHALVEASCVGTNCNCSISVGTFNIGTYAPLSGSSSNGSSNITIQCTVTLVPLISAAYQISLTTGSSGSYTTRKMTNGSYLLNYNIYTDPARTTIWGNGTAGTSTIDDSYLNLLVLSVTRNYAMNGFIPASQNVGPGVYNDSITATVTF
jgi:spore coat protein U-like protein